MWFIPFVVGVGFGKLTGKTWGASALYSGAVTWTAVQIRRGAFLRIGSMAHRVLSLTGYQVLAGVAIGMGVGTATSQLLFGAEGRKAAIDFYTDPFDIKKAKTIALAPARVKAIVQGNRAVANNAAGLPTGTNIATLAWEESRSEFMAPDPEHQFAEWWGTN
jgi:hypothetical protein